MKQIFVVILPLLLACVVVGQKYTELSRRDPKMMYLPFIKIIIPPEPCGAENGNNGVRDGVCLPRGKCEVQKGTRTGDCAKGLGECCRFTTMCNSSNVEVDIYKEVVQIQSPSTSDTDCVFVIRKKHKYCAVKLDFIQYESASPDAEGNCVEDSFTVRGSATVDHLQVCGSLTGQHMYLAYGKSDTIELRPSFTSRAQYQIVVTQIPCISHLRVPDWCLQYYNSTKNTVRSFGFPKQINNQKYTVCVGGLSGGARINWRRCSTATPDPFLITGPPPPGARADELKCESNSDWVQINGESRMCTFPQGTEGVSSTFTPFLLNVHFNNFEKPVFPFMDELARLTQADCNDPLTNESLRLVYTGCTWQEAVNGFRAQCVCNVQPSVLALYGAPDFENTGFCLEYTQS